VQGYCIDAYRRGATILEVLGEVESARMYRARAEHMSALANERLWMEEARRFAFAIDGQGRPVNTIVSNVGHLLWSRVATPEQASATARLLLAPPSYSGYGVRTLAAGQPVYNPLSYHNGTVWPHDNALIARGFSKFDLHEEAMAIFDGLYDAMAFFRDDRLPELFCGMDKKSGSLVRYPVACSPQAWAAAAPFLLLQSILGLHSDAPHSRLAIRNPRLPRQVRNVEVRALRVGSIVSMRFRRVAERCHVERLDVSGAPLKTEIELD
jgi:glycogen debranching enzyme